MPSNAVDRFVQSLRKIDYTRRRMETLYAATNIVCRDVRAVYEALFLRAVTSFEVFLEDYFVRLSTAVPVNERKGFSPDLPDGIAVF